MLKLNDLLKGHIILNLKGNTKEEILKEIICKIKEIKDLEKKESILSLILERENEASTGIGLGVAIPHIRSSLVDRILVYACRTRKGVNFNSIDGFPVHLIFLILIPEKVAKTASKLIGIIVKILSDSNTRENLLKANTEKEFLKIIKNKLNE